jgi:ABC-2 type transport system ATP-binding protein
MSCDCLRGYALRVTTDIAIDVVGLRKRYGDVEVLGGIDLEVLTGEVFGFLGPNGAGKTTTIEILEGYRSRTAGEVSVLGADPAHPTRAWRERVGLVLQECELNPMLTVAETVTLFGSFYRRPRAVGEVIELVGLQEKRDARLGTLSGGQRRRADVAVALVGNPELVFLDEPTTGFDPTARRDAWNMIEGLKSLGTTVLLTTHYMDEAEHLADRVAIVRAGQIVALGRPSELGRNDGESTVITFRAPPSGVEGLGGELGATLDVAGEMVSLRTGDAQATLGKLLAWAQRGSLRLEDLEVHRPSLEDVFLELTGEAPALSDSGGGR